MTQKVNINGQEIELEQCVIDGDELGDTISICGNTLLFPDSDVVEISDQEEFIREYIESNLNSQPDDELEYEYLTNIGKQEVDIMPSYLPMLHWIVRTYNLPDSALDVKDNYNEYLEDYRKELREWWFKRKQERIDGITTS
jgi:hypothetical protein